MGVIIKIMTNAFTELINKLISSIDFKLVIICVVSMLCMNMLNKIKSTSNKIKIFKVITSLISIAIFFYTNYIIFIGLPYEIRELIVAFIIFIPILLIALSLYVWTLKI